MADKEYRITITMKASDNTVGFEVQAPVRLFPIALMQMILGEAQRQLECERHKCERCDSPRTPANTEFSISFDDLMKKVSLPRFDPWEIPLAQMALDEVIRLVNEQRGYINVKLTQQRLREEQMLADLARTAHG